jgi:hypothetical protein
MFAGFNTELPWDGSGSHFVWRYDVRKVIVAEKVGVF